MAMITFREAKAHAAISAGYENILSMSDAINEIACSLDDPDADETDDDTWFMQNFTKSNNYGYDLDTDAFNKLMNDESKLDDADRLMRYLHNLDISARDAFNECGGDYSGDMTEEEIIDALGISSKKQKH